MGNCLALLTPNTSSWVDFSDNKKVLRVVKTDGKILEYRVPILVKDLLLNFDGFGVRVSQRSTQGLPPNYELRVGHVYYLLPTAVSVASAEDSSPKNREGFADGAKRIKVIITKQQLEELLSKKMSIEDVLASVRIEAVDGAACATSWRPKLETIPEGNE